MRDFCSGLMPSSGITDEAKSDSTSPRAEAGGAEEPAPRLEGMQTADPSPCSEAQRQRKVRVGVIASQTKRFSHVGERRAAPQRCDCSAAGYVRGEGRRGAA